MNKSAAFFVENYYLENSLFARSMFLDVQYSDQVLKALLRCVCRHCCKQVHYTI